MSEKLRLVRKLNDFDSLWAESMKRLGKYCAEARKHGEDQLRNAEHHVRSQTINKNFYRYNFIDKGEKLWLCKTCGHLDMTNHYTTSKELEAREQCFHCSHWDDRVKEHAHQPFIVMNGFIYRDGGRQTGPTRWLGFGGAEWRIKMNSGEIIETNNLWCGGQIPHTHVALLPTNAESIKAQK